MRPLQEPQHTHTLSLSLSSVTEDPRHKPRHSRCKAGCSAALWGAIRQALARPASENKKALWSRLCCFMPAIAAYSTSGAAGQ